MSNVATVYWAPCSSFRPDQVNMLWGPPVSLFSTLPAHDAREMEIPAAIRNMTSGNYRACRALTELHKNTHVFLHPKTSTVKLWGDTKDPSISDDTNFWIRRESSLKDCYMVDYDFTWFFFSEDDVQIRQVPPFMHKTTTQDYGFVSTGGFNINNWFRQVNLSYILWPNVDTLKVVEGEPAVYYEFHTPDNRPVVLKQFHATQELININVQMSEFKLWVKNQSLDSLYHRFTRAGIHKRVSKLIKDNLIQ